MCVRWAQARVSQKLPRCFLCTARVSGHSPSAVFTIGDGFVLLGDIGSVWRCFWLSQVLIGVRAPCREVAHSRVWR